MLIYSVNSVTVPVISSGKFAGGGGFAYLDTDKIGGVIFDFFELP